MRYYLLLFYCADKRLRRLAMKYILILLLIFPIAFAQRVGKEVENFKLLNDSAELIVLDDFKGKPILLNFWATWCPPCIEELPMFEELSNQLNIEGQEPVFNIVLVNNNEDYNFAIPFLRDELKITLPNAAFAPSAEQREEFKAQNIILDKGNEVIRNYRVRGMPTTMFVDADGIVRDVWIGFMTPSKAKQLLAKVGVEFE